jgi:chromosome partitioning protein
MPAKIITIATHKGGTSKTVTSVSLSAGLAWAGHSTLLVDCDPQAHSTKALNVESADNEPTLHELIADLRMPASRVIKETHLKNLHVLPSTIRLERQAQALYTRPKREELLRQALKPVSGQYHYIVIDCAPSLGVLTEAAITASNLVVIPCLMEARAADALVDLLDLISALRGKRYEGWKILLTKVDSRKTVTNTAIMATLKQWKKKMFRTTIPQSEPLNQAQIMRTDIFSYAPSSHGALAYRALTKEILRYGI